MRVLKRLLILSVGLLAACSSLPHDFEDLSLDSKIAAYERYLSVPWARSFKAEEGISGHGLAAAEKMVPYLSGGREGGLPTSMALYIVGGVQSRGCDLRGSEAEQAVRHLLERRDLPSDVDTLAESVLESIAEGRHSDAGTKPIPPELYRRPLSSP